MTLRNICRFFEASAFTVVSILVGAIILFRRGRSCIVLGTSHSQYEEPKKNKKDFLHYGTESASPPVDSPSEPLGASPAGLPLPVADDPETSPAEAGSKDFLSRKFMIILFSCMDAFQ